MNIEQSFNDLYLELDRFITDRANIAREVIKYAPKSFSIKSNDSSYAQGWRDGFSRCLEELKRNTDKAREE